ncbi:MAG: hypothetical protein H7122_00650 [Chitinophagaceae bacterium]|nr:hypothetical protein [Chitinophagaceae bacterium]
MNYSDFAGLSVDKIFADQISQSRILTINTLSTTLFLNDRRGKFISSPLPFEAQYGPVFAIVSADFDKDGVNDLLVAGNLYGVAPFEGRYDALMPTILRGALKMKTERFLMYETLNIQGEIRHMRKITLANNMTAIILAINNQPLRFLSTGPQKKIRK